MIIIYIIMMIDGDDDDYDYDDCQFTFLTSFLASSSCWLDDFIVASHSSIR